MPGVLRRLLERRLARFALVGVANTTTDFAVFVVLYHGLGVPLLVANTVAYATGTVQSFVLNKSWTFRDPAWGWAVGRQFARFAAVNLAALGMSNLVVWAAAHLVPAVLAKAIAIVTVFFWNYGLSRRLVFRAAVQPHP